MTSPTRWKKYARFASKNRSPRFWPRGEPVSQPEIGAMSRGTRWKNLRERHDFVVIEGVGGLLAPIWESGGGFGSNLDLMRAWKLPAVLVARRTLGTINHTLLTLGAARFEGLIFNDAFPVPEDDVAAQTGPAFIGEVGEVPEWGRVGFASK